MLKTAQKTLPNLFTIGAAKCGTTSLHHYLGAHPEISMSQPKEPELFALTPWEERVLEYGRMLSADAQVRGESSPCYTFFPKVQGVPERIASRCPDAKLIYMVRDPVERVVAQYVQQYSTLGEHQTLAAAIRDLDQPGNFYVAPSRYATQLEKWLEHFDRERILVIEQDDLRHRRKQTLVEVLEFLEVDPVAPAGIEAELNVSNGKERMTPAAARIWFALAPLTRRLPRALVQRVSDSRAFPIEKVGTPALDDELRALLAAELSEEANRFRALTGKSFASWSV